MVRVAQNYGLRLSTPPLILKFSQVQEVLRVESDDDSRC